jgi:hypothetical protein
MFHQPSVKAGVVLLAALSLVAISACLEKQEPIPPATPLADSFAPFEVISSVAQREGVAIRTGGSSCGKSSGGGAGGPTITSVNCRGAVEFGSPEDAARLRRAVFAELRQRVAGQAGEQSVGGSGTPEDDEMHLQSCSGEERPSGSREYRQCVFLHMYAIERSDDPRKSYVNYFFTLDEQRTVAPPAGEPQE